MIHIRYKMGKKINQPARINDKFRRDMEQLIDERLKKGLMNRKNAKLPKITELLTRTQGYQISLNELRTKKEKQK